MPSLVHPGVPANRIKRNLPQKNDLTIVNKYLSQLLADSTPINKSYRTPTQSVHYTHEGTYSSKHSTIFEDEENCSEAPSTKGRFEIDVDSFRKSNERGRGKYNFQKRINTDGGKTFATESTCFNFPRGSENTQNICGENRNYHHRNSQNIEGSPCEECREYRIILKDLIGFFFEQDLIEKPNNYGLDAKFIKKLSAEMKTKYLKKQENTELQISHLKKTMRQLERMYEQIETDMSSMTHRQNDTTSKNETDGLMKVKMAGLQRDNQNLRLAGYLREQQIQSLKIVINNLQNKIIVLEGEKVDEELELLQSYQHFDESLI